MLKSSPGEASVHSSQSQAFKKESRSFNPPPCVPNSKQNHSYSSLTKHWENKISETVVCLNKQGLIPIFGGSDNGEFVYIGDCNHKVKYQSGPKLVAGSIVLEVQGQNVSGYTQRDVVAWLNNCTQNGNPCVIKTVPSGSLTRDLRQYLNGRFQKGSVDHDLQNTIRDNVYLRTVPVTTRAPRPGETNGVDYTFLTQAEFQTLQRSGSLLEAGIFEGNHYGTPKPPPQGGEIGRTVSSSQIASGAHPSSEGKRKRNRSNVEAMTANFMNSPPSTTEDFGGHLPYRPLEDRGRIEDVQDVEELGPLPPNWEKAYTENGEPYFIDHVAGTSSWLDPRLARVQKRNAEDCGEDELPFGWERIDDPQYGTYYIDHVNRKTQYENPVLMAKKQVDETPNHVAEYDERIGGAPAPSTFPRLPKKSVEVEQMNTSLPENGHPYPTKRAYSRTAFTRNPSELKGDFLRTTLTKSSRGLGFTIVGGDDNEEEFLQIKSVVPNGPAWQDGKLRTGDVLVYVNDTCVLGYTHADVVSMFQSIEPGCAVYLEVCRGYPLPFDPNDPNTEIVTTVAVSSNDPRMSKSFNPDDFDERSRNNSNESMNTAKSMPDLTHTERVHVPRPGSADLLNSENFESQNPDFMYPGSGNTSKPEHLTIPIVKGNMGFGFTIADSSYGQKVKKILDRSRCKNLSEGDILVEINHINVRGMSHSEVVQVLKDCTQGREAAVIVQRGGLSSPSKSRSGMKKNPSVSPKKLNVNTSAVGMYRSKTPTAEMYSSQPKEIVPNRPKTPLVDTRKRSKTPNYSDRNASDTLESHDERHYNPHPPCPGAFSYLGNNNLDHVSEQKMNNLANQFSHATFNGNRFDHSNDKYNQQGPEFSQDMFPRNESYNQNGYSLSNYPYDYSKDGYKYPMHIQDPNNPQSYYNNLNGDTNHYFGSNPHPEDQSSGYLIYPKDKYDIPRQDSGYSSQAQIPPSRNPYPPFYGRNSSVGYFGTPDGYYVPPDLASKKESTSFELEHPAPVPVPRFTNNAPRVVHNGSGETGSASSFSEFTVILRRQENGFGFRIVGGTEEGSQVSVGHIVPGGSADQDGAIMTGDEIMRVDGESVLGSSHHRVVQLMANASNNYRVTLTLRRPLHLLPLSSGASDGHNRSMEMSQQLFPYDITVHRRENEGFGFVIISSVTKSGSTIGRIIEGSPAERCGKLHIGDRILRVNGIDIKNLHHGHIVNLIKESGYTVTLTIGTPRDDASSTTSNSQRAESEAGEEGEVRHVELHRGSRGFGFSIRGGKEFHNMPLFVLRIAEGGPAAQDSKLMVGDQLLEINQVGTRDMTHADAIELIKQCGPSVSLVVRRGGKLPPFLDPLNPLSQINLGSPVGPPPPGTHIRSTATLPSGSPSNGPYPSPNSLPMGSHYGYPGSQILYPHGPNRVSSQPFHSSPAAQFTSNGPPLGQSSPRVPPAPADSYYWNR